uniref:Tetratricopeptide repeat protein putative n=1 Tax=Albugo laibachii Nc14 TaxID=890382 RepID=F0W7B5_9STRA|nr:tetratricopeptide repeat protein putative [Albugo laibachii Nc14]|eukprot:CCA17014.1 tetratricopeptide repeat protein putative [Albugo laibachii Nc14]
MKQILIIFSWSRFQFEDDTNLKQEKLPVIDQTILLALCSDVKSNNPNDDLTREEMMAYIARVLEQPNNWMIQALVDQHTNRLLTPTSLEDVTPAFERMAYVYALAFPPQFALKKDLAERYFALGAVASALELYKELEIWDEVVICYRLLD